MNKAEYSYCGPIFSTVRVTNCYEFTGELIRELSGAGMHWDGKNRIGKDVPEGTYYYIANYRDNFDKIRTFTGFVELIR